MTYQLLFPLLLVFLQNILCQPLDCLLDRIFTCIFSVPVPQLSRFRVKITLLECEM